MGLAHKFLANQKNWGYHFSDNVEIIKKGRKVLSVMSPIYKTKCDKKYDQYFELFFALIKNNNLMLLFAICFTFVLL